MVLNGLPKSLGAVKRHCMYAKEARDGEHCADSLTVALAGSFQKRLSRECIILLRSDSSLDLSTFLFQLYLLHL